jgi:hypothetical protein
MALHAAAANGNWSTAATWNQVTNTPTLHASTNLAIDTTNRFTGTFTAPNTTNACTGVLLYVTAAGTGGTVTVTLQESTVDTAAARTLNITALVANSWVYFRFATPYVFTTTGAGAYRFKVVAASPTGTSNAATDSGGTTYTFLATDDRAAVPASTDNVWIVGHNQATAITVTMDGTQTIGSGTDTTGLSRRTIGPAIVVQNSGLLTWDVAASATLTCRGNIIISASGELRIGTVASPYPSSFVGTLNFDENGTTTRYGLETYALGKLTLQGTPKTSTSLWKTTNVSGTGSTASPLVVTDSVDWTVGDEIMVCAYSSNATNYNESENKFIRVKNSATSYTLADTSGGAESALTHTHTAGAYVLNLQRNVIIKSTTTTESCYYMNENTTAGDVDIDWVRFETIGSTAATNKNGISLTTTTGVTADMDYSVVYRNLRAGINLIGASSALMTLTGNIVCNGGTGAQAGYTVTAGNKTFVDCFAVKNIGSGFNPNFSACTWTRCVAISNNTALGGGTTAGWAIGQTANKNIFNDCESHCNGSRSIGLSGASEIVANNFLSGTKGASAIDFVVGGGGVFIKAAFVNSNFGGATFVSGYLTMAGGSELSFHNLSDTANNHVWYTNTGIARSSGASLVDTTTKTAGNLAVRIAPEDLTIGFIWEFLIGIKANSAAQIVGFAQKNAAFGSSVCTVELFLPGSTVADATATLDNTTGSWQVFSLAASYNGSVGAFATVRITAKTATANAYVYFTDFYNGTNVLTGLQSWYNGKPTPVMTDLLGDPASVWAILTSTQSTAGTIGKLVVDNLNATVGSRASQASVDDIPTNAELATALAAADDAILAAIAALNNLSQANVRSAIGLASANLDERLDALPTAAENAAAVLSAAASDPIDANIQEVNDTVLVGDGSTTPWGPA